MLSRLIDFVSGYKGRPRIDMFGGNTMAFDAGKRLLFVRFPREYKRATQKLVLARCVM